MLKKITMFAIAVAASVLPICAGTPKIVINKGQGNQQAIAFSDIERINFVTDGLEIQGKAFQTLDWSDVATIHFDMEGETVGVDKISAGSSGMRLFEVYSIFGVKVLSVYAFDVADIDKSSLESGIYIVTDGKRSFKFIKK